MYKDQTGHLDEWRQNVLREFTDHRIVSDLWLDCVIWFHMHLYADLANFELECQGWTVRQRERETLLVLKVTQRGTPYVVFVTSSDPIHCMRRLRAQFRDGGPKLVPDKFR